MDGRTGRTGVTLNALSLFFEQAGHNKRGHIGHSGCIDSYELSLFKHATCYSRLL